MSKAMHRLRKYLGKIKSQVLWWTLRPCPSLSRKQKLSLSYKLPAAYSCDFSHRSPWQEVEEIKARDFPGGPVVKNPPCNAGDTGLIPGPGRSHMLQSNYAQEPQLLSSRAITTEACEPRVQAPKQEKSAHSN